MNMSLRVIVALVFLNSMVLFSQEKITKHTIVKGETISSIAEKYEVKQSAILKLNPKAKNLLKLNSVLLIPTHPPTKTTTNQIAVNNFTNEHQVQAKETLYGIAKQYGITLKELNEINQILASSDLKIGQKINIPANAIASETTIVETTKKTPTQLKSNEIPIVTPATFVWEVLPKETKYSITKKYGITIKDFDKANPDLGIKSLKVGQKINIPANLLPTIETVLAPQQKKESTKLQEESQSKVDLSKRESIAVVETPKTENSSIQSIVREVLPKETKYAIAKQYGITVQELEKQNPEIKTKLLVGYKLNISSSNITTENNTIVTAETNNNIQIQTSKIDFNNPSKPTFSHDFFDQLIECASENIGSRYRTGGTTKLGFDCSGLMLTTFGEFDIKLPRTSREQSGIGTKINTEEAQKGDLIFFKTNGRSHINHVGMVVEVSEGEIKFIHSSVSNGVIISSTKEKYYQKNFSQINRVVQ